MAAVVPAAAPGFTRGFPLFLQSKSYNNGSSSVALPPTAVSSIVTANSPFGLRLSHDVWFWTVIVIGGKNKFGSTSISSGLESQPVGTCLTIARYVLVSRWAIAASVSAIGGSPASGVKSVQVKVYVSPTISFVIVAVTVPSGIRLTTSQIVLGVDTSVKVGRT